MPIAEFRQINAGLSGVILANRGPIGHCLREVSIMHKLSRLLAGSVALVTAALSAPGTALATQNNVMTPAPAKWNNLEGTVRHDAMWTLGNDPRHKTDTANGEVELDLHKNVDGGLCVRLRRFGDGVIFAGPVCWEAGKGGQKNLAHGVSSGTVFFVDAKKQSDGSNNDWSGRLFY